jgi:hypothetical protein
MRFKDRYQPSNAEVEMCALFCNAQLFEIARDEKGAFTFFATFMPERQSCGRAGSRPPVKFTP